MIRIECKDGGAHIVASAVLIIDDWHAARKVALAMRDATDAPRLYIYSGDYRWRLKEGRWIREEA